MRRIKVKSHAKLPDLPIGAVAVVDHTPRIEALIVRGWLTVLQSLRTSPTVPNATISGVMEWVGDDPERAVMAYDAEMGREAPRSTLIAKLEPLVFELIAQTEDQFEQTDY